MEFIFYLVFLLKVINAKHPLYYCSETFFTKTIQLLPNEIVFFESYNFPNVDGYLHNSFTFWCNTNFTINTFSKNKRIVILITNPLTLQYLIINDGDNFYFWDPNLLLFGGDITRYSFQGFGIHDEWNDDSCFLESISKINPFEFEDETQILYIRSAYFSTTFRKHPCTWRFIAPENYGFKIVIKELNVTDNTIITATNKTNYYIFDTFTAKLNQSYYNGDNSLTIHLSKNLQTILPIIEFGAYISIVKNQWNFKDANCTVTINKGAITWTNINSLNPNGYANNAHCFYNLTVPSNTLIYATHIHEFAVEANIDTVKYYDEYGDKYLNFDDDLYFSSHTNKRERNILWKFESDGSIRNAGFIMQFWTIYCFCANPIWIVPCDLTLKAHITNTTISSADYADAYCGNMKCNFTIQMDENCSHKFLSFMAKMDKNVLGDLDNLRLISDNETVLYINYLNKETGEFRALLHSNSTIVFEAVSGDMAVLPPRRLSITLETFEVTNFVQTIKLTKEKSYYFVDLNTLSIGDYLNIEVEDISEFKNVSIEIYDLGGAAHSGIILYANENLEKVLQYDDCFKEYSSYCKTNLKKLTIYYVAAQDDILFFQIAYNGIFDNCLLHPNVVILNDYDPFPTFSAIAGPQNSCKVFIMLDVLVPLEGYAFPKIWTNSKKIDVKVYVGINEEILLFKFNKNTMNQWKNIPFNGKIYIIEIPANSSIEIFFNKIPFNPILKSSYASLIYSPYYSAYHQIIFEECFANLTIENKNIVNFYVTYYNLSPNILIQIHSVNGIQNVTNIGKNLTFTNTFIIICFFSTSDEIYVNFPGVIFLMDVNGDEQIITSTTKTTKKNGMLTIEPTITTVIHNTTSAPKTIYPFYIVIFLCLLLPIIAGICVFIYHKCKKN